MYVNKFKHDWKSSSFNGSSMSIYYASSFSFSLECSETPIVMVLPLGCYKRHSQAFLEILPISAISGSVKFVQKATIWESTD